MPNFYSGMPAPITLAFWVPGICECNYDNPTYTGLLKEAAASKDPAKRKELLGQAQQLFGEEAPVVIIGLTSWPAAVRTGVTGVWEDPGATFHLEHAARTG